MPSPSDLALSMGERNYLLLSQSLNDLERQAERHQIEQYLIFDRLIEAGLMEPRIESHPTTFRRQKTRRQHPYTRPMYDTSSIQTHSPLYNHDNSEIQRRRRPFKGVLSSGHPTESGKELGTKENPIYVSEYEFRCEGCNEVGHFIVECTKEYRFDEDEQRYVPTEEPKEYFQQ